MTQQTFHIMGQVINSKTSQGYPDMRVEAWDKDLIYNDAVGNATTDNDGYFQIEFTAEHFQECFSDRRPDIFFKIFSDNQLIKSTEDSVIYNMEAGETDVVIEVEVKHTHPVNDTVFRQVYDSPASLPGRDKWVTSDQDVRKIEEILGMQPNTIGAPLWVSGDHKQCPQCDREINWLDIVSSALDKVHGREMIARVILGEQKFVNTEAPRAIAGLKCFQCGTAINNLRSFKCHNWAYAKPALLETLQQMEAARTLN